MTLYEILQRNADRNLYSIVKNHIDGYTIVSPFLDYCGLWRESGFWGTVQDAAQDIGKELGNSEKDWKYRELAGYSYEGVYHLPLPKPYKPGDLVDLPDTEEVKGYIKKRYDQLRMLRIPASGEVVVDDSEECLLKFSVPGGKLSASIPSHLLIPHIPMEAGARAIPISELPSDTKEVLPPLTRADLDAALEPIKKAIMLMAITDYSPASMQEVMEGTPDAQTIKRAFWEPTHKEEYCYLDDAGHVFESVMEEGGLRHERTIEFGNAYPCNAAGKAKAVALVALRRHIVEMDRKYGEPEKECRTLNAYGEKWIWHEYDWTLRIDYRLAGTVMHISTTEYERAERLKLLQAYLGV